MYSSNWYEHLSFPLDDPNLLGYMRWNLEVLSGLVKPKLKEVRDYGQHLVIYGRNCTMANKGANNGQPSATSDSGFTWVTVELTSADEDILEGLDWTPDELLDNQSELVRDGYSISTKLDDRTGSIACHITCNKKGHKDFGFGITGYSDDLRGCVVVALYKLDHKCKGSLSEFKAERRKYR